MNLGILAHVDAGKTTLTESLLYHSGIIKSRGSVDRGTTITDSLELEQKRVAELENAVERLRKERDEWKAKALNTVTEVMPFDVKLEEYHG